MTHCPCGGSTGGMFLCYTSHGFVFFKGLATESPQEAADIPLLMCIDHIT